MTDEDASYADGVNIDDPVKVYLKEMVGCRFFREMRKWNWRNGWPMATPKPANG